MSQLLSIVHEIQSSFDYKSPTDVRAIIFLHISKAFDKGWHQGLLSKLKSYGVEGDLFRILEIRLDTQKQRVTLDRQCLSWKIILFGVPQDSVLVPLPFLIGINGLPNGLISIFKISAENISIFSKVFDKDKSQRDFNNDLSITS